MSKPSSNTAAPSVTGSSHPLDQEPTTGIQALIDHSWFPQGPEHYLLLTTLPRSQGNVWD